MPPDSIDAATAQRLDFGDALYRLRSAKGLSQRRLAQLAGMASTYLCEIENGRRHPPPVERVRAICDVLVLTSAEASALLRLAVDERRIRRVPLPRRIPTHIVSLLWEIANVGDRLSSCVFQPIVDGISG